MSLDSRLFEERRLANQKAASFILANENFARFVGSSKSLSEKNAARSAKKYFVSVLIIIAVSIFVGQPDKKTFLF